MTGTEIFADVLAANEAYAQDFRLAGLEARAARGLAVLTCIDSRIEPLTMLGLSPGDAKILRNAGARVTDDVLRTLVLASYLLGVDRAMVVAHTKCRMGSGDEDDIHAALDEAGGPDTRSLAFLVTDDQEATVREDVQRVRSWPYLTRLQGGRVPLRRGYWAAHPALLITALLETGGFRLIDVPGSFVAHENEPACARRRGDVGNDGHVHSSLDLQILSRELFAKPAMNDRFAKLSSSPRSGSRHSSRGSISSIRYTTLSRRGLHSFHTFSEFANVTRQVSGASIKSPFRASSATNSSTDPSSTRRGSLHGIPVTPGRL